MKKLFLIISILSLTIYFNKLNAALPIGAYVGLRGGASVSENKESKDHLDINSEYSPFASANAGVRFLRFRGEVEYLYRNKVQTIKDNHINEKISTTSVMGNLYYNFFEFPFIRLYVNAGLGHTDFRNDYIENNNLTYSVGLGASITLAETFSIDAGYRYFDMGKAEISSEKIKFYTNDLYLGIRIGF